MKWQQDFVQTFCLGHATSKIISDKIFESLNQNGLQLRNVLALESDGPNVNKGVWQTINEKVKQSGSNGLLNIGTCNLHVVHNAFEKGIKEYGNAVQEFAIDLHSFFKHSSARKDDYAIHQFDMDIDEHVFMRYVPTRWVRLGAVVDSIIEQWGPMLKYFRELEKMDSKKQPTSKAFRRIMMRLKDSNLLLIKLHFISCEVPLFSKFLLMFQREVPQVCILHDCMVELVQIVMWRYVKSEFVTNDKFYSTDHASISNQLQDDEIVIGEATRNTLKLVNSSVRKSELLGMRKFFQAAVAHLLKKLPLFNKILQSARCFNPGNINDQEFM